jgi:hypothetical protein
MSIAAATNSTRKIGSNSGGTSHSRILDLLIFDILTASGRGGSAMLSVTDNSRGARGDKEDMVTLRRIARLSATYLSVQDRAGL